MRVLVLTAFVLIASVASAAAQTVIATVDFANMQFAGRVTNFEEVDDDGDPATVAYLVSFVSSATSEAMVQLVVAMSDGSLCREAAFNPRGTIGAFASAQTMFSPSTGRTVMKVIAENPFGTDTRGLIRSLDRNVCR